MEEINYRRDIMQSPDIIKAEVLKDYKLASSVILPSQRGQTPGRKWK
ncbi:hypothetical protein [Clostridium sp. JN-9]|nr:hypothetical protein [Clostridium sp. JN-9]